MSFARRSFAVAGIYGLVATLSLYARQPLRSDTLWLYAFAGAAAATQFGYLLIAHDPRRYRLLIPVGIASKLSFAVPVFVLYARDAVPSSTFVFGVIDAVFAGLFALHFVRLGRS